MIAPLLAQTTPPNVIWVPVQKPTFDLVGLILGSLGLTVVLAGIAFTLGLLLGLAIIRRRRAEPDWTTRLSLKLES